MAGPKDLTPIPKGAYFYVSQGCYSDFSVQGFYKAKETINVAGYLRLYLEEHPDEKDDYHFSASGFLNYLYQKDLMEWIETWDLHLTDYSRYREMRVYSPEPNSHRERNV